MAQSQTGNWTVLSTNGGHVFWMGNHPGAFGGYAYKQEIDELLREGNSYDYSRGYRLGLAAIAAAPLQAGFRAMQKLTYFFALETDGVPWNLKGLRQPPARAATFYFSPWRMLPTSSWFALRFWV
jgi:hypothetical protein